MQFLIFFIVGDYRTAKSLEIATSAPELNTTDTDTAASQTPENRRKVQNKISKPTDSDEGDQSSISSDNSSGILFLSFE